MSITWKPFRNEKSCPIPQSPLNQKFWGWGPTVCFKEVCQVILKHTKNKFLLGVRLMALEATQGPQINVMFCHHLCPPVGNLGLVRKCFSQVKL